MHIAASPLQFPDEQPIDGLLQPLPGLSKAVSSKARPDSVAILPTHQTGKGGL